MEISELFTITDNKQQPLFQILKQKISIYVMLWGIENASELYLLKKYKTKEKTTTKKKK